jgi:2-oxoisovalerate dehydrogenase E1 component
MIEIYHWLVLSRKFDETLVKLFYENKVIENPHSNVGQEAVAVGSIFKLREKDWVVPSLRTRPALIMRGVPLNEQFAGAMGKATGPSGGRATTHHLGDNERGIIGTTGIVGSHIPEATGVALACKLRKTDSLVVCFFGDGACNRGDFHEGLNFAGLKKLPIIFVVENNQYAEWTPIKYHLPIKNIAERASSYGFPGVIVDGMDVLAVISAAEEAISRARTGEGPTLIECKTYRFRDHQEGFQDGRPREELSEWMRKDPVKTFENLVLEEGILSREDVAKINSELQAQIDDAVRFGESSPWPDPQMGLSEVYAPDHPAEDLVPPPASARREITMGKALNEALREELTRNPEVFLLGEDIGPEAVGPGVPPMGGTWPPTAGLPSEFPSRLISTPISESEIIGASIGAALVGMRPVPELMYADFVAIAMDQLANTAAKMRYNYGGKVSVPMVMRLPFGAIGEAMHHSQSTEAWLMNVPGLKLVMPSTPYDAKGLFKASIRDDNPVVFFEHKKLYTMKGPVPDGEYIVPLGKADVKQKGSDVTVIATGLMVHRALAAAAKLGEKGISVEVVDPRTLRPLDTATILDSVRRTGRLVIVHEAPKFGGFGAEIAAQVAEEALDYLDAPIARVAAPDTPVPFSPPLESDYVPSEEKIMLAVLKLLRK